MTTKQLKKLHNVGYTLLGAAVLLLSIEAWIFSALYPHMDQSYVTHEQMIGWCAQVEQDNPGFKCVPPEGPEEQ